MNLTDLGYFLSVARAGSFSRAAALAHISPPAISKAIRRLEDDLGTPLFHRTTRSVVMTGAGQVLFERANQIAAEVERTRSAVEEFSGVLRGPLRVAAMEVFSVELLPQALAVLVGEADAVEPQLYEMLPNQIIEQLTTGQLDVGFTIGGHATHAVESHRIGTSPGVLVCGRNHPLYAEGRVKKADLLRHASVVPRFWGQAALPSLDQFDDVRYPRKIGATIELLQSALALAASGRFLVYVPEICAQRQLALGELTSLKGLTGLKPFDLQMLTRRTPSLKPAAKRLGMIVSTLVAKRSKSSKADR